MVDYVYKPDLRKPYDDPAPLFTLNPFDTLVFAYAGEDWFRSLQAPFAILNGQNTVTVNAYLLSYTSAFATSLVGSDNNTIINQAGIDTEWAIDLRGNSNAIHNHGDIIGVSGNAINMQGDGFLVVNTRLINSINGIGIAVTGNNGAIISSGFLGLKGLIHGEKSGIRLIGSSNKIDLDNSGRIITDQGSAYGDPDADGIGNGIELMGSNNEVKIFQIIAGDKGLIAIGDSNVVTVGQEGAPGAGISARTGIMMRGNNSIITNKAGINATESAISVTGDYFNIKNYGYLAGETAVRLVGSNGQFSSYLDSTVKGRGTALSLSGHNNDVFCTFIASTGGTAVLSSGDNNTLLFNTISAALHGVRSTGNGNHVYLERELNAKGEGIRVVGESNVVEVRTHGSILASTAVSMMGHKNTLNNDHTITGYKKGVAVGGDTYTINNKGEIKAPEAVVIKANNGSINNYGTIVGEIAVRAVGFGAAINNIGSIKAANLAVSIEGDKYRIGNNGSILGDILLEGHEGNIINSGSITTYDVGILLDGNGSRFVNLGSLTAQKTAIHVLGDSNKIEQTHGKIAAEGGKAVDIVGHSNRLNIGPQGELIASAQAATIFGDKNIVTNHGVVHGTAALVFLGKSNEVHNDSVISGAQVAIKNTGDGFILENQGIVTGNFGLWTEGNNGKISGEAGSSLSAGVSGLRMHGHHNTVDFKGDIESQSGIAAFVQGNNNELDLAIVESLEEQALVLAGDDNQVTIGGAVSSRDKWGVEVRGFRNRIKIEENGSVNGQGDAIKIISDNNTVENYGSVKAAIELSGTGNEVTNHHSMKEIVVLKGSAKITNATDGTIAGDTWGIGGAALDLLEIDNYGTIEGKERAAIAVAFEDALSNTAKLVIHNYEDGFIDRPRDPTLFSGAAIRVSGNGITELVNEGIINGSVYLEDGNDIIDNKGSITGSIWREIDGQKVLVALDLGGGENRMELPGNVLEDFLGDISGEIWGGGQKDFLVAGAFGNVIRGFGGEDTIYGCVGKDTLLGGDDRDILLSSLDYSKPQGGHDRLDGGAGDDLILSFDGNNTLVGGSGTDVFYIHTTLDSQSFDTITDFDIFSDKIGLNPSLFGKLSTDPADIDSAQFAYSGDLITPATRLIYNLGTGDLFYDRDGSLGEYDPVKILHFENQPLLQYTHIKTLYHYEM